MSYDDILLKAEKPIYYIGDLVIRSGSDDIHLYASNSSAGTGNVNLLNLTTGVATFFHPKVIDRLAIPSPFAYNFKIGDELELNSVYPKESKQYCIKEFGNRSKSFADLIQHYEYKIHSIEPYIACLFHPSVKLSVHSIVDDDRIHVKMAFPNLSHSFGLFSKNNFQLKTPKKEIGPSIVNSIPTEFGIKKSSDEKQVVHAAEVRLNIFARKFQGIKQAFERIW